MYQLQNRHRCKQLQSIIKHNPLWYNKLPIKSLRDHFQISKRLPSVQINYNTLIIIYKTKYIQTVHTPKRSESVTTQAGGTASGQSWLFAIPKDKINVYKKKPG